MARHKKIIFLDIDGVLVNRNCYKLARTQRDSATCATADPQCVEALNCLLDATGAAVVISSTWRCFEGLVGMREILKAWGVRAHVVGCTPDLNRTQPLEPYKPIPRGIEIQRWIEQWPEELEWFVILDDDADMEHLTPNLIQSNFDDGLTMELAEKAASFFREAQCRTD